MGEKILAVGSEIITMMKIPEGISLHSTDSMKQYIREIGEHFIIEDRDKLEGNPDFRQLIPYVVLNFNNTYFSAVRTKEGGDARLHHKRIIGFGGHANWVDMPTKDLAIQLRVNANRELEEELEIRDSYALSFSGFINLLTTPVDKDHLGIYIRVNLDSPLVSIREKSVLVGGGFLNKLSLTGYAEDLENWSKVVLEILDF